MSLLQLLELRLMHSIWLRSQWCMGPYICRLSLWLYHHSDTGTARFNRLGCTTCCLRSVGLRLLQHIRPETQIPWISSAKVLVNLIPRVLRVFPHRQMVFLRCQVTAELPNCCVVIAALEWLLANRACQLLLSPWQNWQAPVFNTCLQM